IRMSGASGRTGCVIASGPDGQPESERPGMLRRIHTACFARGVLAKEVERCPSTRERRASPERERGLSYALAVGEKRERATTCAGAKREMGVADRWPEQVRPETEIPCVLRRCPRGSETTHLRPERPVGPESTRRSGLVVPDADAPT